MDNTSYDINTFLDSTTGEKKLIRLEERSEADQIVLECMLVDSLQKQVELCNSHLKNFQLFLEMDEDDTKSNNERRCPHNV